MGYSPTATPTRSNDAKRRSQLMNEYNYDGLPDTSRAGGVHPADRVTSNNYPADDSRLGHSRNVSGAMVDRTADGYPARRDSLKRKPITNRIPDEPMPPTDQMSRMNMQSTPAATAGTAGLASGAQSSRTGDRYHAGERSPATAIHDGIAKHHGRIEIPANMRLPPNFDLSHFERTDVEEQWQPAVTQERVIPQQHEIIQEAITRDIHVHHYYTYVQPVKVIEVLPAKHYSYNAKTGEKLEIAAPAGWVMPANMNPMQLDPSSLKSYSRHYMVDDQNPRGVEEAPPADFNQNQRVIADPYQVNPVTTSVRQNGATNNYPSNNTTGFAGQNTSSMVPTTSRDLDHHHHQQGSLLGTTTSPRNDGLGSSVLPGSAPAQPTMAPLAHQGKGLPASTALRHDDIVQNANDSVRQQTYTHPSTTTTTTTNVRRY